MRGHTDEKRWDETPHARTRTKKPHNSKTNLTKQSRKESGSKLVFSINFRDFHEYHNFQCHISVLMCEQIFMANRIEIKNLFLGNSCVPSSSMSKS